MILNEIENDFIDFMTEETGHDKDYVREVFIKTKNKFKFESLDYKKLCGDSYELYKIKYDDINEKEALLSYQKHELMHIFRFLSYSYPAPKTPWFSFLRFLYTLIVNKKWHELYSRIVGKFKRKLKVPTISVSKMISDNLPANPIILDYGCGLGYLSFELAKLKPGTKVFLLDIDCLTLRFCLFRFRKHGVEVEAIPVTTENIYPELPSHNLCIVNEVMEHLHYPLTAYSHINQALPVGGLLYGDFEDHHQGMFHVTTDLATLRQKVSENFEKVFINCYKKTKD